VNLKAVWKNLVICLVLSVLSHSLIVAGRNISRYIGSKTENVYCTNSSRIWLDHVQCSSDKRSIEECSHRGWGVHNCTHKDDVAISCSTGCSTRLCVCGNGNPMEFHLGFPYGWEFKLKWAWECSGNGNTTVWD